MLCDGAGVVDGSGLVQPRGESSDGDMEMTWVQRVLELIERDRLATKN